MQPKKHMNKRHSSQSSLHRSIQSGPIRVLKTDILDEMCKDTKLLQNKLLDYLKDKDKITRVISEVEYKNFQEIIERYVDETTQN